MEDLYFLASFGDTNTKLFVPVGLCLSIIGGVITTFRLVDSSKIGLYLTALGLLFLGFALFSEKSEIEPKNKQILSETKIVAPASVQLKYDLTGCASPYNQIDAYYMNDNNERITVGVQECGQSVLNCEVIGDAPKPDENGKIIISAGTQVQCQYGE